MATFNVTTAQNIDELSGKTGGDTYNINGGTLTIDQDSRYGLNQSSTSSLGPVAISATLGGTLEVDARYVRIIPYDGGNTANAPAGGTTVSQGSASGKLICFMASITSAPIAPGAATPAAGFIKIKQWNGTAYQDNQAISFSAGSVTCNVNGTDKAGWITLVGDEAQTITGRRLGLMRFRGEWFDVGQTDGNRATTYQIPTAAEALYLSGVQVETGSGTGVYEWYPCVGSQTALLANIGTEEARGKVCWISSAGVLRFGHDGTNSTGGYCPPTGRNIRIPNIFLQNCTTGARGTNAVPNSTVATRYAFVASGAVISIDKVMCAWYALLQQAYSISLNNSGFNDTLRVEELATAADWSYLCVGNTAAQNNTGLNMSINLAGGTLSYSVFCRYTHAASSEYTCSLTDLDGWTFSNVTSRMIAATRSNGSTGEWILNRVKNTTWSNCKNIGGQMYMSACANVTINDIVYVDVPAGTTPNSNAMYVLTTSPGGCSNITLDGVSFGGLTLVQPYSGLFYGAGGVVKARIRNIGSAATPLDLGGARQDGVSWSRVTTTATVTKTAHGLKANDVIYVIVCSDTSAIAVGSKTVASAPTADTFTFTCTNGGASSGTLSYYPTMSGYVFYSANAPYDFKAQRCYTTHCRTSVFRVDNSVKKITVENVWGDFPTGPTVAGLNMHTKGVGGSSALTAQTNPVYGSHWLDYYSGDCPSNLSGVAWSRTTTTATVTSSGHGLRSGERVIVTVTSDAAAIVLGIKAITVISASQFTFTCLNAGAASGTLSFVPANGAIAIVANEASAETASYVTKDSGNPNFTASGTVYFPSIGDQMTWEMPYFCIGHGLFPIAEVIMGAGTLADYEILYQIDQGSGYSSWKNLSYRRTGAGGSGGSTTVTMTDTTGVAVNDYVFGTGIAPFAKVQSIDSGTNITVDIANTGAVSGTLRFNQLPSETVSDVSVGFKLKVRVIARVNASAAWSYLAIRTYSTSTDRSYQYPLDTATVQMTGLVTGSRVKATKVSDGTLLFNGAESGGSVLFNTTYIGAIRLEARQGSSAPYYRPFITQVTSVADETVSAVALQQLDQ